MTDPQPLITMEPLLLDADKAAAALDMSTSLMQKLAAMGLFPKPRKVSSGKANYLVEDLKEWARTRPVSDLLPPPNSGHGRGKMTKDEAAP
jgi:prophage regulatory protein